MQVTIDVPPILEKKVSQIPSFLKNLLVMASYAFENDSRSLDDVANDISKNAKKRGLDEKKLQDLLQS